MSDELPAANGRDQITWIRSRLAIIEDMHLTLVTVPGLCFVDVKTTEAHRQQALSVVKTASARRIKMTTVAKITFVELSIEFLGFGVDRRRPV